MNHGQVGRWALGVVAAMLAPLGAHGQGMTPQDAREAARFDAVLHAATAAGLRYPMVVAHGDSAYDAMFALLATTRGDSGVLVAVAEPRPGAPLAIVELERDATPANLGVRGVRFGPFLGQPALIDVEVHREPFMLEMSRRFDTHHVLRRTATLQHACTIPGNASSSASKGMRSTTSTTTVSFRRVGTALPLTFETRIATKNTDGAATELGDGIVRYQLPATGECVTLPR